MSDPLAWLSSLEGVRTAYSGALDGIDAVLRDRGLRKTRPEQTTESLLRGAFASAVLAGSEVSLDDFRAGSLDDAAEASARLSTGLLSQVPVFKQSPLQAFAKLHALASKGFVDDDMVGRPASDEAADRLQALATTLTETKQPALLQAAVAHAELISIGAFASHNGLVARAVERLILVVRGVDPASVIVPEFGHLSLRPEYESNLRGYERGGQNGVHSWLLYSAEGFAAGAEASPLRR